MNVDVAATDLETADVSNDVSRGLYCDPMGSVQVNIQTCEVYLRDRMLMPVPPDISGHADFALVFGEGSGSLFCAVREVCRHCRTINIMHGDRVYEVKAWKPFCAESVAMSLDEDDDEVEDERDAEALAPMLLGGLPDQPCYNMPARVPDQNRWLSFAGRMYKPYKPGSCGWVSKLFDTVLEESLRNASADQKPLAWLDSASPSFETECKSSASVRLHLLFYMGPEGDLEETKGHPGAFFEVISHGILGVLTFLFTPTHRCECHNIATSRCGRCSIARYCWFLFY